MEKPAWSDSLDNIAWGGGSVLPLVFPYRELDFYSCAFWKRCVFRQAGVAVCYCTGSIAGRGVLTFCSIQSTGCDMEGSISDGWMMKFWQLFLYQHFPQAREGNSFLLAKVCINHQSLVADCILIHALTLAVLDSQGWGKGCLHISISSSSAPVSMSAQHHGFFSTSQQNLWALRGRLEVQGRVWHRDLEYCSCFLEGATGWILPLMPATVGRAQGAQNHSRHLQPSPGACQCFQDNWPGVPGASGGHRVTLPGLQTIAYRTNVQC